MERVARRATMLVGGGCYPAATAAMASSCLYFLKHIRFLKESPSSFFVKTVNGHPWMGAGIDVVDAPVGLPSIRDGVDNL